MQFIVAAYDFTDDDAINRRLANREAHLAGIKRMVELGTFLSGGAILDDTGKMIGSSAHVVFENRSGVEAWIAKDPYFTGKVWDKISISDGIFFPVNDILAEAI